MSPAEYINKELDREKQAFARAAGRPGVTDEELFNIREKIEVLRKINDILARVSE